MQVGRIGAIATAAQVGTTASNALYIEFTWLMTGPADQQESLTAKFFVTKKGGEPIESKIKQLKEAFAWNGDDIYWFEDKSADGSLSDIQVVVVIEDASWTNRKGELMPSWGVAFINPPNGTGYTPQSGRLSRDDFRERFASKFRAVTGPVTSPAPVATVAPAAPAASPSGVNTPPAAAKPKAKPRAASNRTPTAPVDFTHDQVWEKMLEQAAIVGLTDEDRDAKWYELLDAVAPNKTEENLTTAECNALMAKVLEIKLPF
jgi:hypothetical protein